MAIVGAAVTNFFLSMGATTAVAQLAGSVTAKLLTSVAMSVLSQALNKPKAARTPGLQTEATTSGDTTPQTLIFGDYATAGNHVCPPMSSGRVGKNPNGFLTYVIDVSDLPCHSLTGVWVDDQKITLSASPNSTLYPNHYEATNEPYDGQFWIKFNDGNQTTADPALTTQTEPYRPWTSDMIGRGVAYAICRFRFNRDVYKGFPRMLFEVRGIGFYDPRKDSTVGGSGTHRWGQRNTYEPSTNPIVQIYNILRGIQLMDGNVWGGAADAEDLPLANWFTAMNICDQVVDGAPRYRSSLEVKIGPEDMGGDEPAGIIEEILKTCSGQIFEYGGIWKIKVGGASAPVAVFTDEDIIVTSEQSFEPFKGLTETFNGVHAQYPDPRERWVAKEAPPRYNANYEAEDQGHRLIASLTLPACPYPAQVQRIMRAYVEDERRQRRHMLTLPPDYAVVEPLDDVTWNSTRNGYITKQFEVFSKTEDLRSLLGQFSVRERDPADYNWQSGFVLPTTVNPVVRPQPTPAQFQNFAVVPTSITDDKGKARRPALKLTWDGDSVIEARGLEYQIRPLGQVNPSAHQTFQHAKTGELIVSEGILRDVTYQARIIPVVDGPAAWTSWFTAKSPNVGIDNDDFAAGIEKLFRDQGLYAIRYMADLPSRGEFDGQLIFRTTDGQLYRWVAALNKWVPVVDYELQGVLDETNFAQGIIIPRVVSSLPTTGNYEGRLVVLSTDGKLYRYVNGRWTAAIAAVDVTGLLKDTQIENINVSKLVGKITAPNIADAAVGAAQIADQAITALKLLNGAVTELKLAANAVTAAKIATGAVLADKLAANAVTAAKIADGSIAGTKFASTIKPIEIVGSLPGTPHVAGRVVFLTTDNKLYRNTGTGWTAAIPAGDISGQVTAAQIAGIEASKISGQLTDAQIAALSAAKLAGQITSTQISDNAISAPKISAGAIVADKIATSAITSDKIAANAVIAAKIQAGAVEAAKIAAGAVQADKIAAGAVVAGKLSANAVEAGNIAANAITTGKIAAGAVSADQIASNAITAIKIAANAISAEKLAANAVIAGKIAAGAVTAQSVEAGAITAVKLAAGAVTSEKITAGAIGAEHIAAKAIVSSKLAVGDFTNFVPDAEFRDRASWIGSTWATAAGWNGRATQLLSMSDTVQTSVRSERFMVEAGKELYVSFWGRADVSTPTGQIYMRLRFYNLAGTMIYETPSADLQVRGGTPTKSEATVVVPADADKAEVLLVKTNQTPFALFGNPTVRLKSGGELIVDGAITTAKLAAGSVEASKIAAGAITASKIAVGSGNLLLDPEYYDLDGYWYVNRAVATVGVADRQDSAVFGQDRVLTFRSVASGPSGWTLMARSNPVSIQGGQKIFASIGYWHNRNATFLLRIGWLDANQGWISSANIVNASNVAPSVNYATHNTTAPATAAYMRVEFHMNRSIGSPPADFNIGRFMLLNMTDADLIVNGAIVAEKIATNAITTNHINANAITAAKIATAAITTDKIAANAVSSDKIEANAITAAKIAAGAIGADQIAANAIVSSKIAITDFTNLVPDNELQDPASWNRNASFTVRDATRNDLQSTGEMFYTHSSANNNQSAISSKYFPVSSGDQLFISCQIIRTSGTTTDAAMRVVFYDRVGTQLATNSIHPLQVQGTGNTATPYERYVTVPAAAFQARIQFYVFSGTGGTNNGNLIFAAPVVRVRGTGKLIVDGTITGNKIVANTITGGLLATSGIITSAAQITDGLITNAKITNASITYLKVAGQTLYVPRFWTRADTTLGPTTSQNTPLLLFDRNIPDFDGGGYLIAFNGILNNRIDYDNYGRFQLLIDNVVVMNQSFGLRTSGANTGGEMSINMIASYYGQGTTNVKVRGWSHPHSTYVGGNVKVEVANMSLTVSGSRR